MLGLGRGTWAVARILILIQQTYVNLPLSRAYFFSAMRRDILAEVSSKGMIKTGLKSDICQVC